MEQRAVRRQTAARDCLYYWIGCGKSSGNSLPKLKRYKIKPTRAYNHSIVIVK